MIDENDDGDNNSDVDDDGDGDDVEDGDNWNYLSLKNQLVSKVISD